MEFRQLTRDDLSSLLDLYVQLSEENRATSPESSAELWEKEIEPNDNIRYFGAVDNGRVVASCYAVYIPNLTRGNRGICFIENVVTDEEYRHRGLASKVVGMAVEFARERGCYKAMLQSGSWRTGAHTFYEQLGFDGSTKKAFDMRFD